MNLIYWNTHTWSRFVLHMHYIRTCFYLFHFVTCFLHISRGNNHSTFLYYYFDWTCLHIIHNIHITDIHILNMKIFRKYTYINTLHIYTYINSYMYIHITTHTHIKYIHTYYAHITNTHPCTLNHVHWHMHAHTYITYVHTYSTYHHIYR